MKKIFAGFNRVLCKEPDEIKQSAGGILLPNGLQQNAIECEAIEVGPKSDFDGDVTAISKGDTLVVSSYAGATFIVDEVKYRSVELKDIIAIIKNN
jgi:co-chaperonin GroES (HSP10)